MNVEGRVGNYAHDSRRQRMLAQRRMQRKTMNDSTTSDLILVQSVGRALSSSCTLVGGVSSERRPSIMIAARVDWVHNALVPFGQHSKTPTL